MENKDEKRTHCNVPIMKLSFIAGIFAVRNMMSDLATIIRRSVEAILAKDQNFTA